MDEKLLTKCKEELQKEEQQMIERWNKIVAQKQMWDE